MICPSCDLTLPNLLSPTLEPLCIRFKSYDRWIYRRLFPPSLNKFSPAPADEQGLRRFGLSEEFPDSPLLAKRRVLRIFYSSMDGPLGISFKCALI